MLSCGWDLPHPKFKTNLYWNATVDPSKVLKAAVVIQYKTLSDDKQVFVPPWIPLEEMHPSLQYSV